MNQEMADALYFTAAARASLATEELTDLVAAGKEWNPDDPGPGNAPAGPESPEEDRKNTLGEDHVEEDKDEEKN